MTTTPKLPAGPRATHHELEGAHASGDATSIEELLATLPLLADEARRADERLREQVALLKDRRATWAEIGSALNVTRQAAWERFAGGPGARARERTPRSASR
jgi:hypothetical protein